MSAPNRRAKGPTISIMLWQLTQGKIHRVTTVLEQWFQLITLIRYVIYLGKSRRYSHWSSFALLFNVRVACITKLVKKRGPKIHVNLRHNHTCLEGIFELFLAMTESLGNAFKVLKPLVESLVACQSSLLEGLNSMVV
jgi:hypothetical protein